MITPARIGRGDVLGLVLEALPSVAADLDDAGELPYVDAGAVASHAVGCVASGRVDAVRELFDVIERLHVEGDDYVRELATVGYLEGLQNVAGNRGVSPALLEPLLGPESLRWWRGLDAFWSGSTRGVQRGE